MAPGSNSEARKRLAEKERPVEIDPTTANERIREVGAYVAKTLDVNNGGTYQWQNAEVLELLVDVMNLLEGRQIGTTT